MKSTPGARAREVHAALERAARSISADTRRKRAEIYGTALVVLGLAVPEQRKIAAGQFGFLGEDERENLRAWDQVYRQSPVFEARSLALIYYETRYKELAVGRYFATFQKWAGLLDNWEHADRLSKIFADFLEREPDRVYPVLERWNRSRKAWSRRLSIVSLLCYANLRKSAPPASRIFPLLENLLFDPDLYVQKGLGWTLRETGHIYPAETRGFIEKFVVELTPIAFTAALEKAPASYREKLKARRKAAR